MPRGKRKIMMSEADVQIIDMPARETSPQETPKVAENKGEVVVQQERAMTTESQTIFSMIERVATNKDFDIERMQRLIDMQERMQARQAQLDYNNAMADAQAEMEPVRANKKNDQTNSRYATYDVLDAAIRPIYAKHGFALSFDMGEQARENWIRVLCDVSHRGGHVRQHHIDLPADGLGPKGTPMMTRTHATVSAVSYGKRGLLGMIFNLAVFVDDDGNAAGGRTQRARGHGDWVQEATDDGIVDTTRPKGRMPKPGVTITAEEIPAWTDRAVQTLNLGDVTVDSVKKFAATHGATLKWIKEASPAHYEKISTAYSNAMEAAATNREKSASAPHKADGGQRTDVPPGPGVVDRKAASPPAAEPEGDATPAHGFKVFRADNFRSFIDYSRDWLTAIGRTPEDAQAWEANYRAKLGEGANHPYGWVKEGVGELMGIFADIIQRAERV